jgi:hypothetical protein
MTMSQNYDTFQASDLSWSSRILVSRQSTMLVTQVRVNRMLDFHQHTIRLMVESHLPQSNTETPDSLHFQTDALCRTDKVVEDDGTRGPVKEEIDTGREGQGVRGKGVGFSDERAIQI